MFCLLLLLTLSQATSFQKPTSGSASVDCNNPFHNHRHHTSETQLSSTASSTVEQTVSSSTTSRRNNNEKQKQRRRHPMSSVFEPESTSKVPFVRGSNATTTTTTMFTSVQDEIEYQRRKQEWAARYTTLNGLRETFGSNRNKLWGDLDPTTTRRLYKSLLPTALCELVLDLGVRPEELAPLAYEARKAAKLYARERCHVPARVAASLYDGFRQFKRYGKFQPSGMSYDQVWDKYRRITYMEKMYQHHQQQRT